MNTLGLLCGECIYLPCEEVIQLPSEHFREMALSAVSSPLPCGRSTFSLNPTARWPSGQYCHFPQSPNIWPFETLMVMWLVHDKGLESLPSSAGQTGACWWYQICREFILNLNRFNVLVYWRGHCGTSGVGCSRRVVKSAICRELRRIQLVETGSVRYRPLQMGS